MTPQPKRTANRLKRYDYSRAGWYFVTICVKDRLCILAQATDHGEACVGDDACIVPQPPRQDAACPEPSLPALEPAGLAEVCDPCVGDDACIVPQPPRQDAACPAAAMPRIVLTPLGRIVETELRRIPGIREYVVMPNHLHCIVCISGQNGPMQASAPTQGGDAADAAANPQNLSQRIRIFKARVTRAAGRPLFQRSFYDAPSTIM